ncbi:hypothetical protein RBSWK_05203 [Rhodopirellula baltica SWK14]|uniref:Uncharacterized protein n=1 Tax=Rhodopirellula baltica SWK14 TaxID=993516 RepID=L7CBB7_RHOBT|nr:hypothetical protein RBSWK_05203 [Rhodopirellula baltica SWK14]
MHQPIARSGCFGKGLRIAARLQVGLVRIRCADESALRPRHSKSSGDGMVEFIGSAANKVLLCENTARAN